VGTRTSYEATQIASYGEIKPYVMAIKSAEEVVVLLVRQSQLPGHGEFIHR
jgi:hypothetical protein